MANLNKTPEQINRALGQRIKGSDRAIAKRYAVMLNEVRAELASLYEKYEVGGVLTYAEMAKYDRLNKFTGKVNGLLKTNYADIKDTIYDVLGESYKDGFYMTAWAVETDTLSKLAYSAVSAEVITKSIENPISGLTLNHRLEKSRSNVVYAIQEQVTLGLVQGDTYGTMASRLKGVLEGDATKAMAIVRTEAHRVSQASQFDSAVHANRNGIIMTKEWGSSKDERTRSSHANLEGTKIPVDQDFEGKNGSGPAPGQLGHPSEDIRCRCVLYYSVESIGRPNARELEGMAFDTWQEERIRGEG
ncbi:phage minor head protein [Sporosarcina sp. FSL K6-1508]|uniref:phage minor head protein n=1 Tax=Sporosarcina sp. FSL K6-1508 TaxID=2921553 RepID=UPI0030F5B09B